MQSIRSNPGWRPGTIFLVGISLSIGWGIRGISGMNTGLNLPDVSQQLLLRCYPGGRIGETGSPILRSSVLLVGVLGLPILYAGSLVYRERSSGFTVVWIHGRFSLSDLCGLLLEEQEQLLQLLPPGNGS